MKIDNLIEISKLSKCIQEDTENVNQHITSK